MFYLNPPHIILTYANLSKDLCPILAPEGRTSWKPVSSSVSRSTSVSYSTIHSDLYTCLQVQSYSTRLGIGLVHIYGVRPWFKPNDKFYLLFKELVLIVYKKPLDLQELKIEYFPENGLNSPHLLLQGNLNCNHSTQHTLHKNMH